MSSKAKFGLAGLSTVAARTKQNVFAKVGKNDETVDIGFKQEHDKFEHNYKILKKLAKEVHDWTKNLRAISDGHRDLGESISGLYDSGSSLWTLNQTNQAACIEIDKARQALEEALVADVVTPIDKYLSQYKLIEKRCTERDRRRVDMDRYRLRVKDLQQHAAQDPTKLPKAEAEYNAAKAGYDEINDELIRDMLALNADRTGFFDPCFAAIILAQANYYARLQQICGQMVGMAGHIDPKKAHDMRFVITDESVTAAAKVYAPGDYQAKAPQYSAAPAYSSQPPAYGGGGGQPAYGGQAPPAYGGGAPPAYGGGGGGYPPQQGTGSTYGAQPVRAPPSLPGRPGAPAPRVEQAQALYAFNAEAPTELSFQPGQILTIITRSGDWWEAEINGRRGLVPANYLQMM